MKLITRNTDYAVRALCYIAKQDGRSVTTEELIDRLRIPKSFLRKILQTLSNGKVLLSFKGQGGGFLLVEKPQKIFLTDLIRIFQNTIQLNECIFKKKICPNRKTCMLRKKINQIEKNVQTRLASITIASLVRKKQGG